jgi:hypothetical protein
MALDPIFTLYQSRFAAYQGMVIYRASFQIYFSPKGLLCSMSELTFTPIVSPVAILAMIRNQNGWRL